jgi:hypothetical protein
MRFRGKLCLGGPLRTRRCRRIHSETFVVTSDCNAVVERQLSAEGRKTAFFYCENPFLLVQDKHNCIIWFLINLKTFDILQHILKSVFSLTWIFVVQLLYLSFESEESDLQAELDLRISCTSYSIGPSYIKQYLNEAALLRRSMRLYLPIMKWHDKITTISKMYMC